MQDSPIHTDDGVGIELFLAIGDRPLPLSAARHYGTFYSNPVKVDFGPEEQGRIATYYSRWITDDGQAGEWSGPTSVRIRA